MRSFLTLILLATLGVQGCTSSSGTTEPAAVSTIQVDASITTVTAGQTITLGATPRDAQGNALTGRTLTWTSSNTAIATVSPTGVVTGVSPGQATITATVGTISSVPTTITVVAPPPANCNTAAPLSLNVGDVHTLTTAERATLCLAGGTLGTEYLLVPFNSSTASTQTAVQVSATGTSATTGTAAFSRTAGALEIASPAAGRSAFSIAFEQRLRARERNELRSKVWTGTNRAAAARFSRSAILGLPTTPAVGTAVQLNANSDDACINRRNHGARVAAISNAAIVVVDSGVPANGFTDAEYLDIATTFDTLVFALDTTAFGPPSDVDGNGRVILFFTQAVNQLTAPSDVGFIGGFFFARDLVLSATNCAGSNQGEMFYLPAVDPTQIYNRYFRSKDTLKTTIIGTVAHEFQHLINASRRAFVTGAPPEEVWLDEGLAHLAEELLFYRVSGLTPKLNLGLSQITATQARVNAVNNYQIQNFGRLNEYLKAPDINSPYAPNDSLATRGGTWELLRYALDQSPLASTTYTHALENSTTTGVANFDAVFGAGAGTTVAAARKVALANFMDDNTALPFNATYTHPSWNFRSILPALSSNNSQYPLATRTLTSTQSLNLPGGGSAYLRFRVGVGTTASVISSSGSSTVPANIDLILVRTK